ncbi:MAG: ribose 5-phosphate isomerase A [Deltaproteobacteria bacterium]|nr:ribose 5-phosphate isomerase A [Deltaproteobacteria bacterium]
MSRSIVTDNDTSQSKKVAAEKAVGFVKSGMIVGLGHGSTAIFAVRMIAEKVTRGDLKNIYGICCSREMEKEARELGITLTTLDEHSVIDLTIDGADEVDSNLNCIKGGGGALLREKMVAQSSRREIIVVDESKMSPRIGTNWPLPIEVVPFGWQSHIPFLKKLGGEADIRINEQGMIVITDQGNYILDAHLGPIYEPEKLELCLSRRAGIVEHGLFLGLATDVIVAGKGGITQRVIK